MANLDFELEALARGRRHIAGMDEVGRGPLAGPVVTACVILPLDELIEGVTDSKRLSQKKRHLLEEQILAKALAVGYGQVEHDQIDRINILNATRAAMEMAVTDTVPSPDEVLVDAVTGLHIPVPYTSIIKGDLRSYLIGAASILAKERRDALMHHYDTLYPGYGFARNMGYGTAEHMAALRHIGPCPIHRRSFIRKILEEYPEYA